MIIKMDKISGGKKGVIGEISVKEGELVKKGQELVQVEVGKGNKVIEATMDGKIIKVLCQDGDEIDSEAEMFIIEGIKETDVDNGSDSNNSECGDCQQISSELLIIGGGPGGYVAAVYAAKKGMEVTLIEKDKLGGTCLNVGCIPTKALVKSSEIANNFTRGEEFGIESTGEFIVNMEKVISRKDEVKDRLVSGVEFLMKKNKIKVIKGEASFIDSKTVSVQGVDNFIIEAKDIIIGTGSKISQIPIPGIDLPFVLNSTTALSSTELPKSITIIGGGVIGMEFAFIYNNLGVEVTVIEFMDRVLTMVDKDISREIKKLAKKQKIQINNNSKVIKIEESDDGNALISYEDKKGEHTIESEKVLVAIGREPNMDSLNIESTGLSLNENDRGIKVDGAMRTTVENIYAIGDVTDIIQLAHVASHQGIVAVDNIIGENREMDYSAVPNVIFTSPEIANVGINEDEAKEKGMDITVSKFRFMGNGKALTMGAPDGFAKLIKDNATNKIIGSSIIGADASSLISILAVAIQNGLGEKEMIETIFPHPTTSEVIHEASFGLGLGALHQ